MDRGAWWATVHGVTKSWTPPKRLSMMVTVIVSAPNATESYPKIWLERQILQDRRLSIHTTKEKHQISWLGDSAQPPWERACVRGGGSVFGVWLEPLGRRQWLMKGAWGEGVSVGQDERWEDLAQVWGAAVRGWLLEEGRGAQGGTALGPTGPPGQSRTKLHARAPRLLSQEHRSSRWPRQVTAGPRGT